ncbi:MAG TPA: pyruvate, water dikinase regulatory protein [Anaerolineales bacterium]
MSEEILNIFAVSDATGTTAERVVQAALIQFDGSLVSIKRYGGVRKPSQIHEIMDEASEAGGFVVHTFVSEDLRTVILNEGRASNVMTFDLMGPLLARLSELLATAPRSEPGMSFLDSSYMQRIDAIDFTVRHDDGRNVHDIDRSEIVLLGVSRTSKTPLSIYLAYRGWRVANVPLILTVEPAPILFELPRKRVVGLVVKPERLSQLRKVRAQKLGIVPQGYADLEHIRKEITYAYEIFERRRDWPIVDVTNKSIEEAAAEVVALLGHSFEHHDRLEI